VVKNEERRMGLDVSIVCDNCREKSYLGRELHFSLRALGSMVVRGLDQNSAANHVLARRDANIAEQALVEAFARGWRFHSSTGVASSAETLHHCPSCVEKKVPFGPRNAEVRP